MLGQLNRMFSRQNIKQFSDPRNVGLIIFAVIVLAIAWSGARTLQNNYQLQKKISALKQQNTILQLQNENVALQNQYYTTKEYLDLAARQDLGLAAPGEKVLLIPRSVALKYVDQSVSGSNDSANGNLKESKISQNFEAWRDFLLGRQPL